MLERPYAGPCFDKAPFPMNYRTRHCGLRGPEYAAFYWSDAPKCSDPHMRTKEAWTCTDTQ